MNLQRLYALLNECSTLVRVGEVKTVEQVGSMQVTTIDAMPAETDLVDGLTVVDLVLVKVAVDMTKANALKQELVGMLDGLPTEMAAILKGGPSYIALGAVFGDQGVALQFIAVGAALGLWSAVTPAALGITDPATAKQFAGSGLVMMSGYISKGE
jgi:hypothetical protein